MDYQRVEGGREYVARLERGGNWRGRIGAFAGTGAFDARLERERDEVADPDPWNV